MENEINIKAEYERREEQKQKKEDEKKRCVK